MSKLILILWIWNPGSELKQVAQYHTTSKTWRWSLGPGLPNPQTGILLHNTVYICCFNNSVYSLWGNMGSFWHFRILFFNSKVDFLLASCPIWYVKQCFPFCSHFFTTWLHELATIFFFVGSKCISVLPNFSTSSSSPTHYHTNSKDALNFKSVIRV